jgi:hypothetical protein
MASGGRLAKELHGREVQPLRPDMSAAAEERGGAARRGWRHWNMEGYGPAAREELWQLNLYWELDEG